MLSLSQYNIFKFEDCLLFLSGLEMASFPSSTFFLTSTCFTCSSPTKYSCNNSGKKNIYSLYSARSAHRIFLLSVSLTIVDYCRLSSLLPQTGRCLSSYQLWVLLAVFIFILQKIDENPDKATRFCFFHV